MMRSVVGLAGAGFKAVAAGAVAYVTIGGWLGLLLPMVLAPAARCEPVRLATIVVAFCDDVRAEALWWALIGLPAQVLAPAISFLLWVVQDAAMGGASELVVRMHYDVTFRFDTDEFFASLAVLVLAAASGIVAWRDASPLFAWFWAVALIGVVTVVAFTIRA